MIKQISSPFQAIIAIVIEKPKITAELGSLIKERERKNRPRKETEKIVRFNSYKNSNPTPS